ncbi:putative Aph-1 protein [Trypanosoma cruzi]|nr:putative Aph-1 protein [Trypanosoma cruzi]
MYLTGMLGCGLLLYAPLLIASFAAIATHPQLLLLALSVVLVALFVPFISGVLYLVMKPVALLPLLILVDVTITEFLRVWLLFTLYRVESVTRSYGQLIVASPMRFALVSAAVGCGFGAISVLRGAGTLFDSTQRMTFYTRGTTAYDLNVCPRLPLLMHSTLQAFLLLLCQVAWAVMTGQAVTALQKLQQPQKAWRRLLLFYRVNTSKKKLPAVDELEPLRGSPDTQINVDTPPQQKKREEAPPLVTHISEDEEPHRVCPREWVDNTEQREKEGDGDGEERGEFVCFIKTPQVAMKDDGGSQPLLPPREQEETQLPEPTLLRSKPLLAVASLLAPFLLHLLFAMFSLFNSGAYNKATQKEVPRRGCVISLPLQASVTAISLLWMAGIIHVERARVAC